MRCGALAAEVGDSKARGARRDERPSPVFERGHDDAAREGDLAEPVEDLDALARQFRMSVDEREGVAQIRLGVFVSEQARRPKPGA